MASVLRPLKSEQPLSFSVRAKYLQVFGDKSGNQLHLEDPGTTSLLAQNIIIIMCVQEHFGIRYRSFTLLCSAIYCMSDIDPSTGIFAED